MSKIYAIILAGGKGTRMGKDIPKQFLPLNGRSVLIRSIEKFHLIDMIDNIIVVLPEEYIKKFNSEIVNSSMDKVFKVVKGGKTRQGSVYNAVTSHNFNDKDILIFHDAARPFVDTHIIIKVIEAVRESGAAGTYIPAIDTISEIESGFVRSIPPREKLFYTQTPQAFLYKIILDAHKRALSMGIDNAADDVSLVIASGYKVKTVEGSPHNIKITTEDNYLYARYLSGHSNK